MQGEDPLAGDMHTAPRSQFASSPGRWQYWRFPVFAGAGFCALQIALFAVRFGIGDRHGQGGMSSRDLLGMLSGLGLFFLAGLLAALLVRRLLQGSRGAWRRCLLVIAVIATPLSVLLSLAGGLLGPPMVVAYALVPYLLLVGIPALAHKIWRLSTRSGPSGGNQVPPGSPTGP